MATDLVMGSDRANALQSSIQKALSYKGYSPEDDTVMAEYITIMLINDKSPDQVTQELKELIGDGSYDPTFTEWLFAEKANEDVETAPTAEILNQTPSYDTPPPASVDTVPSGPSRSQTNGQNSRMYQQAISSLPGPSPAAASGSPGQKRTASQRSPSPSSGPPNAKRRQADLPDRPRAMRDDGPSNPPPRPGRTSLLDRVGPRPTGTNHPNDHVQERIRAVTQQSQPNMHPQMMQGGFPPGMDPAAMAMMQQQGFNPGMMGIPAGIEATMMALQQFGHLAVQMGLVPGAMGMGGPGMMQGQPGMNGQGGPPGFQGDRRRNGPGVKNPIHNKQLSNEVSTPNQQNALPAAPQPSSSTVTTLSPTAVPFTPTAPATVIPTRPLSPTLCKFVTNCTNPTCRYSHPSPVATVESGVVLSTEPCEKGLDCDDKDCLKAHVSKAAKTASAAVKNVTVPAQRPAAPAASPALVPIPCKFDPHCTRPNCPYTHAATKYKPKPHHGGSATQCRFGAGCTRVDCTFAHPPGRVLPNQFSKGLNGASPTTISQKGPERETWNKSVDFRAKAAPPGAPSAGDKEAGASPAIAQEVPAAAAPTSTEATPVAS